MTASSLDGAHLLIVEDDYVVADSLRFLLESYGGTVTAIAASVARALDALATEPVEVAVLDINLHGASVVPLAEHLLTRGVPFVFLTGYGDAEVLPEHLRDHPRLRKPVLAEMLIQTICDLRDRQARDPR